MSKQTAVEWLLDKLPHSIETQFATQIEQAKAMEREQIIDAWQKNPQGFNNTGQQYFNKTYGGDK
jgi:uncharacterized protein HemY